MTEPVVAVLAGALLKPVKADGATVLLLVDAPNNEDVVLAEGVEAVEVVVKSEDCAKVALAGTSPNIGLKFWTEALLSDDDAVVVAGKMGLNPAVSRGLVLLADWELMAGAAVVVTGLLAEEAERVLIWPDRPKRVSPATGAGGVLLGALEISPSTSRKAEGCPTPAED